MCRMLRLTTEQKCDIATRELEELRDEIDRLQDECERVLDSYRVNTHTQGTKCVDLF